MSSQNICNHTSPQMSIFFQMFWKSKLWPWLLEVTVACQGLFFVAPEFHLGDLGGFLATKLKKFQNYCHSPTSQHYTEELQKGNKTVFLLFLTMNVFHGNLYETKSKISLYWATPWCAHSILMALRNTSRLGSGDHAGDRALTLGWPYEKTKLYQLYYNYGP